MLPNLTLLKKANIDTTTRQIKNLSICNQFPSRVSKPITMPVAVTPEEAPAPQMSNQTQGKRKKIDQPDQADQPEIYFKAFRPGEFRQLSNLFGPVEWKYQQAKFKEGSEVYNFLEKGYQKTLAKTLANKFTFSEFEATLKAMGHGGKVESYVDKDSDNKLATGLIAQMTSLIAKNPESALARQRLKYIIGLASDEILPKDWHEKNVNKVLTEKEANELMLRLLREKYEKNEEYKNLLLKSGKRILHEGKGRGAPNKWEWQEKPLSSEDVAKGRTRGGDELGRLLTQVRTEIQEPSPPSAKRNALQPSS